jgi:hypothetical protein
MITITNNRPAGTTAKVFVSSLVLILCVLGQFSYAQKTNDAYVDKNGVLRWGKTNEEVKAFGINYTAMFAHAYRTAKRWNIPLEKAIDDDVYHFARLGFDLFRVHVWDTEISDTVGNLLTNENLRLFDYTLKKMKDRGMKFVITPIAYWGNGWPERDDKTPGFSAKHGKGNCLTNPDAIKAQEKYLNQFLDHVNPYTNVAYKNDPDIIAFEISNEPHHNEAPEKVTEFINKMVKSMRATGCKKPILYNISHSIHLMDAYFKADIQGGTFQWYPTNLGAGHELEGNLLRNLEIYKIPFAENPGFKKGAKIVYEFDAADVGRSYIYPAMARSFRTAGMQIATHFAYDPTFMAHVNTEYGTHYMNLVYAPQKALSLMIAGEVFHRVPMYKSFGQYPDNTTFGDFEISYEKDLAEMVTPTTYLYTNNTSTAISDLSKLEKIAGFGNSNVVNYQGQGVYFLDRLESGVWRLEVMPDAIWKHDPFEKTSLKKTIALIQWQSWRMSIDLPDLGENFSIKGVNDGNSFSGSSKGKDFVISPGTYLLVKNGKQTGIKPEDRFKNIVVKEFAAPEATLKEVIVKHDPAKEFSPGNDYQVDAAIFSPDPISVELYAAAPGSWMEKLPVERVTGNSYKATIPSRFVKEGTLRYHFVIERGGQRYTYPSGLQTHPWDWDFYDRSPYVVTIIKANSPVVLFSPKIDGDYLMRPWIRNSTTIPLASGGAELTLPIEKLFVPDPENRTAAGIYDYSMQVYIGEKATTRKADISRAKNLIVSGRSLDQKERPIQVALITKSGDAFGGLVQVNGDPKEYKISLSELKPVKVVSLPRPYPTFLPYFVEDNKSGKFDVSEIEFLQISVGPGMNEEQKIQSHGIAIESIRLE